MMLASPRIRSPKGSSPSHHFSKSDLLCAGFLRHFKVLLLATIGIAMIRLVVMPAAPFAMPNVNNDDYSKSKSSPDVLPEYYNKYSDNNDHGVSMESDDNDDDSVSHNEKQPSREGSESVDDTPAVNEAQLVSNDPPTKSDDPKSTDAVVSSSGDNTEPATATKPSPSADTKPSTPVTTATEDLLQLYNASLHPLLPDSLTKQQPTPLQVHLIVDVTSESGIVEPSSKFLLDAMERSKYLQAVGVTFVKPLPPLGTMEIHARNVSFPLLYLVDFGSLNRDCHRLQLVLQTIQQEYDNQAESSSPDKDNIYTLLVDFTGSTRQTHCDFLFPKDDNKDISNRVRLAKRSIVQDRYFDHDKKEIHLGSVSPNEWNDNGRGPVIHSPLVVREAFITSIQNITKGEKVEDLDRSVDVGMFWTNGDYSHLGFYRRDIAKVVKTLHHSKITTGTAMENQVGLSYTDVKGFGQGNIQFQYVRDLLACKIVVVAQRDEYEDHYRLMESLASGALVMTDKMLAMPDGLGDKVNVIVYDSPSELKKLIKYYLQPENEKERKQIALEGFKLVMGRHRCWHRLEELIFGKPLTSVDKPYKPAPEKEQLSDSIYWVAADDGAMGPFL